MIYSCKICEKSFYNAKSLSNHFRWHDKAIATSMRKSMEGMNLKEKNGMWKGNNVSYKGLHCWINENKEKSKRCEECGKKGKIDFAYYNHLVGIKTPEKYTRVLSDWKCLCRSCHMKLDGRIKNLKNQ